MKKYIDRTTCEFCRFFDKKESLCKRFAERAIYKGFYDNYEKILYSNFPSVKEDYWCENFKEKKEKKCH